MISSHLPKHIKKGHQLIFSRQELTSREADLFALMIAKMKVEDWDNTTPHYEFSTQQLSEWLNIKSKHVGSNLSPVANRLSSRKIGIKRLNNKGSIEFDYRPLFKHIAYQNSTLTMVPNDMLRSAYIEHNKGFALINTRNFLGVKKEYSKRLYELISRFKNKGFDMHGLNIVELKGLFGLLDETGEVKKDKASFKNNSVFMKRCIRDSIKELSENLHIRKELLFIESEQGDLGFELVKSGRKITSIKFLFRWINRGTFGELNQQEVMKTIRVLESKCLQERNFLCHDELNLLAMSYRYIGKESKANRIEESITKYLNKSNMVIEKVDNNEIELLLSKIEQLEKVCIDNKY